MQGQRNRAPKPCPCPRTARYTTLLAHRHRSAVWLLSVGVGRAGCRLGGWRKAEKRDCLKGTSVRGVSGTLELPRAATPPSEPPLPALTLREPAGATYYVCTITIPTGFTGHRFDWLPGWHDLSRHQNASILRRNSVPSLRFIRGTRRCQYTAGWFGA
jgi:hypothetical protein